MSTIIQNKSTKGITFKVPRASGFADLSDQQAVKTKGTQQNDYKGSEKPIKACENELSSKLADQREKFLEQRKKYICLKRERQPSFDDKITEVERNIDILKSKSKSHTDKSRHHEQDRKSSSIKMLSKVRESVPLLKTDRHLCLRPEQKSSSEANQVQLKTNKETHPDSADLSLKGSFISAEKSLSNCKSHTGIQNPHDKQREEKKIQNPHEKQREEKKKIDSKPKIGESDNRSVKVKKKHKIGPKCKTRPNAFDSEEDLFHYCARRHYRLKEHYWNDRTCSPLKHLRKKYRTIRYIFCKDPVLQLHRVKYINLESNNQSKTVSQGNNDEHVQSLIDPRVMSLSKALQTANNGTFGQDKAFKKLKIKSPRHKNTETERKKEHHIKTFKPNWSKFRQKLKEVSERTLVKSKEEANTKNKVNSFDINVSNSVKTSISVSKTQQKSNAKDVLASFQLSYLKNNGMTNNSECDSFVSQTVRNRTENLDAEVPEKYSASEIIAGEYFIDIVRDDLNDEREDEDVTNLSKEAIDFEIAKMHQPLDVDEISDMPTGDQEIDLTIVGDVIPNLFLTEESPPRLNHNCSNLSPPILEKENDSDENNDIADSHRYFVYKDGEQLEDFTIEADDTEKEDNPERYDIVIENVCTIKSEQFEVSEQEDPGDNSCVSQQNLNSYSNEREEKTNMDDDVIQEHVSDSNDDGLIKDTNENKVNSEELNMNVPYSSEREENIFDKFSEHYNASEDGCKDIIFKAEEPSEGSFTENPPEKNVEEIDTVVSDEKHDTEEETLDATHADSAVNMNDVTIEKECFENKKDVLIYDIEESEKELDIDSVVRNTFGEEMYSAFDTPQSEEFKEEFDDFNEHLVSELTMNSFSEKEEAFEDMETRLTDVSKEQVEISSETPFENNQTDESFSLSVNDEMVMGEQDGEIEPKSSLSEYDGTEEKIKSDYSDTDTNSRPPIHRENSNELSKKEKAIKAFTNAFKKHSKKRRRKTDSYRDDSDDSLKSSSKKHRKLSIDSNSETAERLMYDFPKHNWLFNKYNSSNTSSSGSIISSSKTSSCHSSRKDKLSSKKKEKEKMNTPSAESQIAEKENANCSISQSEGSVAVANSVEVSEESMPIDVPPPSESKEQGNQPEEIEICSSGDGPDNKGDNSEITVTMEDAEKTVSKKESSLQVDLSSCKSDVGNISFRHRNIPLVQLVHPQVHKLPPVTIVTSLPEQTNSQGISPISCMDTVQVSFQTGLKHIHDPFGKKVSISNTYSETVEDPPTDQDVVSQAHLDNQNIETLQTPERPALVTANSQGHSVVIPVPPFIQGQGQPAFSVQPAFGQASTFNIQTQSLILTQSSPRKSSMCSSNSLVCNTSSGKGQFHPVPILPKGCHHEAESHSLPPLPPLLMQVPVVQGPMNQAVIIAETNESVTAANDLSENGKEMPRASNVVVERENLNLVMDGQFLKDAADLSSAQPLLQGNPIIVFPQVSSRTLTVLPSAESLISQTSDFGVSPIKATANNNTSTTVLTTCSSEKLTAHDSQAITDASLLPLNLSYHGISLDVKDETEAFQSTDDVEDDDIKKQMEELDREIKRREREQEEMKRRKIELLQKMKMAKMAKTNPETKPLTEFVNKSEGTGVEKESSESEDKVSDVTNETVNTDNALSSEQDEVTKETEDQGKEKTVECVNETSVEIDDDKVDDGDSDYELSENNLVIDLSSGMKESNREENDEADTSGNEEVIDTEKCAEELNQHSDNDKKDKLPVVSDEIINNSPREFDNAVTLSNEIDLEVSDITMDFIQDINGINPFTGEIDLGENKSVNLSKKSEQMFCQKAENQDVNGINSFTGEVDVEENKSIDLSAKSEQMVCQKAENQDVNGINSVTGEVDVDENKSIDLSKKSEQMVCQEAEKPGLLGENLDNQDSNKFTYDFSLDLSIKKPEMSDFKLDSLTSETETVRSEEFTSSDLDLFSAVNQSKTHEHVNAIKDKANECSNKQSLNEEFKSETKALTKSKLNSLSTVITPSLASLSVSALKSTYSKSFESDDIQVDKSKDVAKSDAAIEPLEYKTGEVTFQVPDEQSEICKHISDVIEINEDNSTQDSVDRTETSSKGVDYENNNISQDMKMVENHQTQQFCETVYNLSTQLDVNNANSALSFEAEKEQTLTREKDSIHTSETDIMKRVEKHQTHKKFVELIPAHTKKLVRNKPIESEPEKAHGKVTSIKYLFKKLKRAMHVVPPTIGQSCPYIRREKPSFESPSDVLERFIKTRENSIPPPAHGLKPFGIPGRLIVPLKKRARRRMASADCEPHKVSSVHGTQPPYDLHKASLASPFSREASTMQSSSHVPPSAHNVRLNNNDLPLISVSKPPSGVVNLARRTSTENIDIIDLTVEHQGEKRKTLSKIAGNGKVKDTETAIQNELTAAMVKRQKRDIPVNPRDLSDQHRNDVCPVLSQSSQNKKAAPAAANSYSNEQMKFLRHQQRAALIRRHNTVMRQNHLRLQGLYQSEKQSADRSKPPLLISANDCSTNPTPTRPQHVPSDQPISNSYQAGLANGRQGQRMVCPEPQSPQITNRGFLDGGYPNEFQNYSGNGRPGPPLDKISPVYDQRLERRPNSQPSEMDKSSLPYPSNKGYPLGQGEMRQHQNNYRQAYQGQQPIEYIRHSTPGMRQPSPKTNTPSHGNKQIQQLLMENHPRSSGHYQRPSPPYPVSPQGDTHLRGKPLEGHMIPVGHMTQMGPMKSPTSPDVRSSLTTEQLHQMQQIRANHLRKQQTELRIRMPPPPLHPANNVRLNLTQQACPDPPPYHRQGTSPIEHDARTRQNLYHRQHSYPESPRTDMAMHEAQGDARNKVRSTEQKYYEIGQHSIASIAAQPHLSPGQNYNQRFDVPTDIGSRSVGPPPYPQNRVGPVESTQNYRMTTPQYHQFSPRAAQARFVPGTMGPQDYHYQQNTRLSPQGLQTPGTPRMMMPEVPSTFGAQVPTMPPQSPRDAQGGPNVLHPISSSLTVHQQNMTLVTPPLDLASARQIPQHPISSQQQVSPQNLTVQQVAPSQQGPISKQHFYSNQPLSGDCSVSANQIPPPPYREPQQTPSSTGVPAGVQPYHPQRQMPQHPSTQQGHPTHSDTNELFLPGCVSKTPKQNSSVNNPVYPVQQSVPHRGPGRPRRLRQVPPPPQSSQNNAQTFQKNSNPIHMNSGMSQNTPNLRHFQRSVSAEKGQTQVQIMERSARNPSGTKEPDNTEKRQGKEEENADFPHLQQVHGACILCGKYSLYLCSNCRKIWYCSPSCQLTHWETHALECSGEAGPS